MSLKKKKKSTVNDHSSMRTEKISAKVAETINKQIQLTAISALLLI